MVRCAVSIVLCIVLKERVVGLDKDEPQCLSRFDHDYKVLQKLVMLEQQQVELRETITKQQEIMSEMELALKGTDTEQSNIIHDLQDPVRRLQSVASPDGPGSTYVRWGRTSCPGNGTELVYEGYAGGSHHNDKGAAANYLCLPIEPLWGLFEDAVQSGAEVWGAEYELDGRNLHYFFGSDIHNDDVPCAVCRTTRASILMIPGRNACYTGWNLEYKGYLTAGHMTHFASEFVCLDANPEMIAGGHDGQNGKLFYFAEARCGSLKCPPYVHGRELTCAVCTK